MREWYDEIGTQLTSRAKILQSFFITLQVIVYLETLVILIQCSELAKERQIFSRILKTVVEHET